MSQVMPKYEGAAESLATALSMTRKLLDGEVTPQAAQALVATRALLVQRAREARPDGWSDDEQRLIDRLVAADRELVQKLWSPRRDAFRWLRERNATNVDDMPHLRRLDAS